LRIENIAMRDYFAPNTTTTLRLRLLNAALTLYMAVGYYRAKTSDIARLAKTTESNLYRLFSSKDGLLKAVYDECWQRIVDQLKNYVFLKPAGAGLDPVDTLEAELVELLKAYDDQCARDIVAFAFAYFRRPERLGEDDWESPYQEMFQQHLRWRCQEVIDAYPGHELDADTLTEVVLGYLVAVWLAWVFGADEAGSALTLDAVVKGLRRLLRPPPPGGGSRTEDDSEPEGDDPPDDASGYHLPRNEPTTASHR
jgi:AcrR family transcriptional regulator